MNINDKNDVYNELYRAAKITNEDLKQFEEFKILNEDDLAVISDELFSLATLAQKTIIEYNDWFKWIPEVWEEKRGYPK